MLNNYIRVAPSSYADVSCSSLHRCSRLTGSVGQTVISLGARSRDADIWSVPFLLRCDVGHARAVLMSAPRIIPETQIAPAVVQGKTVTLLCDAVTSCRYTLPYLCIDSGHNASHAKPRVLKNRLSYAYKLVTWT